MRTFTNHMLLSITLLTPVVGTMTTYSVHAEESAYSEAQKYVHEFFTAATNFDNGYTVAGLQDAVLKICQETDNTLAEEWKKITIVDNPEQAADFLFNNKATFTVNGKLLFPEKREEILAAIKETIGWEFIDRLLFSNDQNIITTYQTKGWDALVTDLRNLMNDTQFADIANDIPRSNEFTSFGSGMVQIRRMSEIQTKLQKHSHRFPDKIQAKNKNNKTHLHAQDRMQDLIP